MEFAENMSQATQSYVTSLTGDLMFLSHAKPGDKPCFHKRYYVSADSWFGALYRVFESESMEGFGILTIERICKNTATLLDSERSSLTRYEYEKLIGHVQNALAGLCNIHETYTSIQKTHLANQIKTNGIDHLERILNKLNDTKSSYHVVLHDLNETAW